ALQSITGANAPAHTLARLAEEAGRAGELDPAAQARSVGGPTGQARVLIRLAKAAIQTGGTGWARALMDKAMQPGASAEKMDALTRLAEMAARTGDLDQAGTAARQAQPVAKSGADAAEQARTLCRLAAMTARAGDLHQARALDARAE